MEETNSWKKREQQYEYIAIQETIRIHQTEVTELKRPHNISNTYTTEKSIANVKYHSKDNKHRKVLRNGSGSKSYSFCTFGLNDN